MKIPSAEKAMKEIFYWFPNDAMLDYYHYSKKGWKLEILLLEDVKKLTEIKK
jgi:hypothetical protein